MFFRKNVDKYLSLAVLKSVKYGSSFSIEWELISSVQFSHFSTGNFNYITDNSQSQNRLQNRPIRSQEQLNQLFEVELSIRLIHS